VVDALVKERERLATGKGLLDLRGKLLAHPAPQARWRGLEVQPTECGEHAA
jgi:hypothetical protein